MQALVVRMGHKQNNDAKLVQLNVFANYYFIGKFS